MTLPGARERLSAELHRLRNLAGLSGRGLSERIQIPQSRISRIESAKSLPNRQIVLAWADATGADRATTERLTELAEAVLTEVAPWRAVLGDVPHLQEQAAELERTSRLIRSFQPTIVPGLLQTAEYARRIIPIADVTGQVDHAAALARRLERQQALYDETKRFEIVLTEQAARWNPGLDDSQMAAQRDRLRQVATLANVRVLVVHADRLPALGWSNFVVYDERADDDEPVVTIELVHGSEQLRDPRDVELYREVFARLRDAGVEPGHEDRPDDEGTRVVEIGEDDAHAEPQRRRKRPR